VASGLLDERGIGERFQGVGDKDNTNISKHNLEFEL
jgi:hypothetical protein